MSSLLRKQKQSSHPNSQDPEWQKSGGVGNARLRLGCSALWVTRGEPDLRRQVLVTNTCLLIMVIGKSDQVFITVPNKGGGVNDLLVPQPVIKASNCARLRYAGEIKGRFARFKHFGMLLLVLVFFNWTFGVPSWGHGGPGSPIPKSPP